MIEAAQLHRGPPLLLRPLLPLCDSAKTDHCFGEYRSSTDITKTNRSRDAPMVTLFWSEKILCEGMRM
jgi:hypothetical protein